MKKSPKTGLYISTKKVKGMRLVVEVVFGPEDEEFDEDEFYLVNVIGEVHKHDALAIGDELDSNQWEALVEEYGLVYREF
ncbi:hypothetical protein ACK30Y_02245 [Aeromonas caviae]